MSDHTLLGAVLEVDGRGLVLGDTLLAVNPDDVVTVAPAPGQPMRHGSAVVATVHTRGRASMIGADAPWSSAIPAIAAGDLLYRQHRDAKPEKQNDALREQLRADVATMRELGVLRWVRSTGEVVLGPVPTTPTPRPEPPSAEELAKRKAAEEKRVLFLASGYMPKDEP